MSSFFMTENENKRNALTGEERQTRGEFVDENLTARVDSNHHLYVKNALNIVKYGMSSMACKQNYPYRGFLQQQSDCSQAC